MDKSYNYNNFSENELERMLTGKTISIKDYLTAIKVNWKQVLLIIVSTSILAAIYAIVSPDIFRSTTMLKLSKPKGSILEAAFDPDLRDSKSTFVQNEVEVLNSYTVKEKVARALIDSLKINKYPQYYLIFDYDESQNKWMALPVYKIIKKIEKKVSVEQKDELDIINITAESTSAYEASLLANIYANVYHEMSLAYSRSHMMNIRRFLDKQSREKQQNLTQAENSLRNFQEKDGIIALDDQSRALINQLTDFESKRNAAKIDLTIAEKTLADYKTELSRQKPHINDYMEKYAIEPYLEELQKGIAKYEVKRDLALNNNDAKNKEVAANYNERINELKAKRDEKLEVFKAGMLASSSEEVKQLLQKVVEAEVKYHATLASYNELSQIVNNYESKFNSLPKKTIDLARLEREKGESEKLYLILQEKYQEAVINEQSTPDNVLIIDYGKFAYEPVKPNRPLLILIGLIFGSVLSLVYVTIKNSFDNKVHSPEEIQKHKLNLLGWIPKIEKISGTKTNPEFIIQNKPDSIASEAYKVIRTRIQFTKQNSWKTILLTSSLPNEGKTLTALNLAGSFAQAGLKTVLVDCDLRKPRIHKIFREDRAPGISDYLSGNVYYQEIIRSGEMNNLFFIASGTKINNPSEILGSVQFYEFLKNLEKDFDIVIVDSSPVLAVTDAEILSHLVDIAILVIAANSTEIDIMTKAAELLQKEQNTPIGVLLNNFVYKNGYGSYYKSYTYYNDNPQNRKVNISNSPKKKS